MRKELKSAELGAVYSDNPEAFDQSRKNYILYPKGLVVRGTLFPELYKI